MKNRCSGSGLSSGHATHVPGTGSGLLKAGCTLLGYLKWDPKTSRGPSWVLCQTHRLGSSGQEHLWREAPTA